MKINLWYSKSMSPNEDKSLVFRASLLYCRDTCGRVEKRVTKTEQHSGQQPMLRDAMEDVAKTVEYMLECKDRGDYSRTTISGRENISFTPRVSLVRTRYLPYK